MKQMLSLHTGAELTHFAIKHGLVELGPFGKGVP
jgi:hypothetical protein